MSNLSKAAQMIVDYRNGTFQAYSADGPEQSAAKLNEALRAKFSEILPPRDARGRYNYRKMQRALPEVFEIIEEVLDITINDAWRSDPFYRQLVDARNLALGDKNEFIIEDDSLVVVNEFSGNHWDTDRQSLAGRRKVSLDTRWFVAHVYGDFERFLIGAITVDELLNKITEAFARHVDTMIATVFNDATSNLPPEFQVTATLNTPDLNELILRVQTASGKNVAIMGTKMAIAQLNAVEGIQWSEKMMNEVYTTGRLGQWMGNKVVEIPQAFERGTYNWLVDNNFLLVCPENDKFIKFVDEGDTRSQEKTEDDNHDQVLSWQVQRKMGAGAVFGSKFGRYEIM